MNESITITIPHVEIIVRFLWLQKLKLQHNDLLFTILLFPGLFVDYNEVLHLKPGTMKDYI